MYYVILAVIALIIILLIAKSIEVVPQSRAYIIERLGAYSSTYNVGIHFKLPFIDRVAHNKSTLGDTRDLLRAGAYVKGV